MQFILEVRHSPALFDELLYGIEVSVFPVLESFGIVDDEAVVVCRRNLEVYVGHAWPVF